MDLRPTKLDWVAKMSCPICETQLLTHASYGVAKTGGCRMCDESVCPECYHGMRYTCKIFKIEKEKHECVFCKSLDYKYFMYKTVYDSTGEFMCSECAEAILSK
jgi:hypothetical protein